MLMVVFGVLLNSGNTKNAEAALIQSDYLTLGDNLAVYDEDTDLTWLDLSVTDGKAYESALIPHHEKGFNYAKSSHVTQLFLNFFGETVSYNSPGYSTGNNLLAQEFSTLFGLTSASSSFGFFFDNENKFSLFGVTLGGGKLYAPDFPVDYNKYYDIGNSGVGTYLVKQGRISFDEPVITAFSPRVAVPEPASLLIFIFGSLGLFVNRRISSHSD